MRHAAAILLLIGLVAAPAGAQVRSGRGGIPPGQLPPPGTCRVWFDNRPAGRQPPPMSCRDAERMASRDRYARVIYGSSPGRYPYADRNPYPYSYPDRYGDPRGGYGYYANVAIDNGYRDGLEKGREDARDRDSYDPVRHRWYRSGDRDYERRYGPKLAYENAYREGFRAGYDRGYRDFYPYGPDRRRDGIRSRWPF